MSGSGLEGTVPTDFGQLTKLREVYLQNNRLTGTLPSELGFCTSTSIFTIGVNQLTGTVPSELGDLVSLGTSCVLLTSQCCACVCGCLAALRPLVDFCIWRKRKSNLLYAPPVGVVYSLLNGFCALHLCFVPTLHIYISIQIHSRLSDPTESIGRIDTTGPLSTQPA